MSAVVAQFPAERIVKRKGDDYALALYRALAAKLREPGVLVLVAIISAALLSTTAAAQTSYFRGPDGRDSGRVERGSDGTQRFYDSTGRNAGHAEPGSDGTTRLYDRDGRNAGTIERATPGMAPNTAPPRGRAPEGGH